MGIGNVSSPQFRSTIRDRSTGSLDYMLYNVDQSVGQSRCTCLVLSSIWTS